MATIDNPYDAGSALWEHFAEGLTLAELLGTSSRLCPDQDCEHHAALEGFQKAQREIVQTVQGNMDDSQRMMADVMVADLESLNVNVSRMVLVAILNRIVGADVGQPKAPGMIH